MEESLKMRIILILVVIVLICSVVIFSSCTAVSRLKAAHNKEMSARLDLEEQMTTFTRDKKVIEQKLNALTEALQQEEAAHQETKKKLLQEEALNKKLSDEVDKLSKLKETLEEDLKEALVTSRGKTKR